MMKPATLILLLGLCLTSTLASEVLFDPPSAVLSRTGEAVRVVVSNREDEPLEIDFLSSAEGITVTPSSIVVEGGATASFVVGRQGESPAEGSVILMLSNREDVPYLYSVLSDDSGAGETESSYSVKGQILFFYTPGCTVCDKFYSDLIPELEVHMGKPLNVEKLNVFESGSFEVLRGIAEERGVVIRDFPALVTEDMIFLGEKEIFEEFPASLKEEDYASKAGHHKAVKGGIPELHWIPIFLAGLLDGINPCAFTSLIFMISYLRLVGRKGRDILWIGGSFTLAVFLCYFLIGLGAFQFLRAAATFAFTAALIRYVLGAGLLILAVLSLVDYIRVRQGRASDSILQLSAKRKKKIHSTLRKSSRSALLCLSSFGAGFLISLYELGCTGQIYLPMLVYMLKQGHKTALGPLFLYNTAFILPLVVVFIFFYKGSDSDRIGSLFTKHLGKIKLMTALLFLGMGLFVLLR